MNRKTTVLIVLVVALALLVVGAFSLSYRGQSAPSVVVNGAKYWTKSLTLTDNLTIIRFSGIVFNFSYPCNLTAPPPPQGGIGQICNRVTFTTISCPSGTQPCQGSLPQVRITFPNGTGEYFNSATIIQGVITYDSQKLANHVYFTTHTNPEVGIEWVTDHGPPDTLLLLVSA